MNNSTPIWGPDHILVITSAYHQGSRAIRLSRKGDATSAEELWFTNRFRLMFTHGIRIGHHLYGTSGDFGPAFLGALDVRTGDVVWQERGFSRAKLVHADGKLIILDEDGQLALVQVSPDGVKRLASTKSLPPPPGPFQPSSARRCTPATASGSQPWRSEPPEILQPSAFRLQPFCSILAPWPC